MLSRLRALIGDIMAPIGRENLALSAEQRRELSAQRWAVEQLIERDSAAYLRSRRSRLRR
jgi:hypothetical protein